MNFKILSVIVMVFLAGCTQNQTEDNQTNQNPTPSPQPTPSPPNQTPNNTLQGTVFPLPNNQPTQTTAKEFTIEADDNGFYINGSDTASIAASRNDTVMITFMVRTAGTYYQGLDFRGCAQDTEDVKPGNSTKFNFTAESTCTITSYWPSSGVAKDTLQVVVSS